ncbi:MAG: hypothetical protein IKR60_02805 [Alphaproteobacteria bacterium]|nr:hypothetical protein [Alphaproteobacteria bacterium]
MDKSLLKYETKEEIKARTDEIMKTWQSVDDENYIFSAKHQPTGIHMAVDSKDDGIDIINWADSVRNMKKEGLSPSEIASYREKLKYEFERWVEVTDEQLMQQHSGQNFNGMSLRDVVSKQKQKS